VESERASLARNSNATSFDSNDSGEQDLVGESEKKTSGSPIVASATRKISTIMKAMTAPEKDFDSLDGTPSLKQVQQVTQTRPGGSGKPPRVIKMLKDVGKTHSFDSSVLPLREEKKSA